MTRFSRQEDILDMKKLETTCATIIGAGSVGSFTALSLAKMGIGYITAYDNDGISEHNLSNQFYKNNQIDEWKVTALGNIIEEFADIAGYEENKILYTNQPLDELTIVCPDNMKTRREVYDQFMKQPQTKYLIDARMGGEMANIHLILDKQKDAIEYEKTLCKDEEVEPLKCSERTIIYCVMMIASLICRTVKAVINEEKDYPKEIVFGMRNMNYMKIRG